jgi:hypothetical protein
MRETILAGYFYFPNTTPAVMLAASHTKCPSVEDIIQDCLDQKLLAVSGTLFKSCTSVDICTYQLTDIGTRLIKQMLQDNNISLQIVACKQTRAKELQERERVFLADLTACHVLVARNSNVLDMWPLDEFYCMFVEQVKMCTFGYFRLLMFKLLLHGHVKCEHELLWYA